jgi:hypothetical protein
MIKIFLSSIQSKTENGIVETLYLRDSANHGNARGHLTEVPSGSKVCWELEKESGIKSVTRIWVTEDEPHGKVFKKEPKKTIITRIFEVDSVVSKVELEDKYCISYIPDNGEEKTVDPMIRIIPH